MGLPFTFAFGINKAFRPKSSLMIYASTGRSCFISIALNTPPPDFQRVVQMTFPLGVS